VVGHPVTATHAERTPVGVEDHSIERDSQSTCSAPSTAPPTWPWWSIVALLLVAALVAAFRTGTGYVTGDRFELFWSPWTTFSRGLHAWDYLRGLGGANPQFVPIVSGFLGLLRTLGLPPGVTERIFHATLLGGAGLGAATALRLFRPVVSYEHLVTGLLFMFNPFTAVFFTPALLFVNYALAPWFLVCFVCGVRGPHRWRYSALFALLFFIPGMSNLPGTLWAMLPLVAAAWYLVAVERSATVRTVVAWLARAGFLTLLVSIAGLVKASIGASTLSGNLQSTESAQAVSIASSWSESWRGLGFWLSYWIDARGVIRPDTAIFFTSAPIILVTFVAPIAAFATIVWTRWRARLLCGALIFLGLLAMSGAYPYNSPTPFGRLLISSYTTIPGLFGFRNTYKAGATLLLGVGLLCAVGVTAVLIALRHRAQWSRVAFVIGVCVVFLVASWPFWSGEATGDSNVRAIPSYYREAFDWLDRQPGEGRVFVLPGSGATTYRWGNPGDDIIDAELSRAHVMKTVAPLSAPETNTVVQALDDDLTSAAYVPGTLAPLARRLGIEYVLLRNDIDWETSHVARPDVFDALRDDPSLVHAKSFGAVGENVTARGDHSRSAHAERQLPPVEILKVPGVEAPLRFAHQSNSVLISGDGAAWPGLGALTQDHAIRYTGDLTPARLGALLSSGAALVVTDTNRRRVDTVGAFGRQVGSTLTGKEKSTRAVKDLFGGTETQTVASWGDASTVTALTSNKGLPIGEGSGPARAFDGDQTTSWLTGALTTAVGQQLRIQFPRPTRVSSMELRVADPCCSGRVVSRASIHLPDGTTIPVNLEASRTAHVEFAPRQVRSLTLRIDAARGGGDRPIGFSEIKLGGLDVRRYLRVPDDVFLAAEGRPALRRLVETAPITYDFTHDDADSDVSMLRRFTTTGSRDYAISGNVTMSPKMTDDALDRLLGRPVGAVSSVRATGAFDGAGTLAVDGNRSTGWVAPAQADVSLAMRFPNQEVRSVSAVVEGGSDWSRATEFTVQVGEQRQVVPVLTSCAPSGAKSCQSLVQVSVPPTSVDHLTLSISGVDKRTGAVGTLPVRVDEVYVNDAANATLDKKASLAPCSETIEFDGAPAFATVRGTVGQLLDGASMPLEGCAPVHLGAGKHILDAGRSQVTNQLQLSTVSPTPTAAAPVTDERRIDLNESRSARIDAHVSVPTSGAIVVANRSFTSGWKATLDGKSLGDPISVDAQVAWKIPAGEHHIVITFAPQGPFDLALLLTDLALAACAGVIVIDPKRRHPCGVHRTSSQAHRRVSDGVIAGVVVVGGFLVGGVPGGVVAGSAIVAARLRSSRFVAAAGCIALALAAVLTVLETTPKFGPGFASNRPIAAWAGVTAGVLLLVAIVEWAREARLPEARPRDDADQTESTDPAIAIERSTRPNSSP
jgi:arabinofuranan 3-O-arabinosyltransferase